VFASALELLVEHNFRPADYRATVLRCRVAGAGNEQEIPGSVIVKRFRSDPRKAGERYDPEDVNPTGPRARFLNEWAGLALLQDIGDERPFGPALHGGDGRIGLVVLEDLGEGECLADHLQGDDPVRAENALLAYATTLGRMHAATSGHHADHAALRRRLASGGADPAGSQMTRTWLARGPGPFREACARLDLAISAAAADELASLTALVEDPGAFLAFSVGDTCPDNHRYVPGDPGNLRFYDMEFGGFQHALLDAAYLWMPFPTCWCVGRLPEQLPPRLEAAYRVELARGVPAAVDDRGFERGIAEACAVWFVLTVAWSLVDVLERDESWGISTVRQRFPLRAGNFARAAERAHCLPALNELARRFAERVRELWGEEAEMPLYSAFRKA
jgi:hypothetical protein